MGIGSAWEPTPTVQSTNPDATPSPGEFVIIMLDVSKISILVTLHIIIFITLWNCVMVVLI